MCLRPCSQVADARTPLLKFNIEREILVLESPRLGKNYLVISDIGVKLWPKTMENSSALLLLRLKRELT